MAPVLGSGRTSYQTLSHIIRNLSPVKHEIQKFSEEPQMRQEEKDQVASRAEDFV